MRFRLPGLSNGLSTRLIIASVSLVLLTALSIEFLADRNLEQAIVPTELERLQTAAQRRADELGAFVQEARSEILSVVNTEPVKGLARAHIAGGFDAAQNSTEEQWRQRLANNMVSIMNARPDYYKFRLIGIANGGREIVRVDRMGKGRTVRIVPESELQLKNDRPFFREAVEVPVGQVYTSMIELNQDFGKIEVPHVPVLRVSSMIDTPDGKHFAVLIANINVERLLMQLVKRAANGTTAYLVDRKGNYIVHPDSRKTFGLDLGVPTDWRKDFPGLLSITNGATKGADSYHEKEDEIHAVAASILPSEPFYAAVILTKSRALIVQPIKSIQTATRAAGSGAVLIAILFAIIMSRSMTKPLEQLTKAVEKFDGENELVRLPKAGAEVGTLAQAFQDMSAEVREKTTTLKKLYEMERLYGAVVESSADAILTIGLDGNITAWNAAAERIFGYSADEIIGKPVALLQPQDRKDEVELIIDTISKGNRVENLETIRIGKDGSPIQVSLTISPVYDAKGSITWASKIVRDIREQKLLEERLRLAQKMEAVGTLAGGIAHDFNNILTTIVGNTRLAREDLPPNHEAHQELAEIERAAARGASVVRQILRISRSEDPKNEPINLESTVEESVQFLRATKPDNVEIRTQFDPDMPFVLGDPTEMHQVIMNLCVNALHAMRELGGLLEITGSVVYLDEVAVGTFPNLLPGRYIRLSVSDTGMGMDAQTLSRIFEPFFTTKGINEGTGLGLSVVYGIVERHRGVITAYSEPGKGTMFRIYFPAVDSVEPSNHQTDEPSYEGNGEKVMYVDDDESLVLMVTRMLRRLKYEVYGYSDPQEALSAFLTDPASFDIIVTDMSMPKVDGPEFVRQLLAVRPNTPIVMVTGYIRPEDTVRTRDLGIRALVLKPNTVQDMGRVLHDILEQIRNGHEAASQS